MNAQAHVELHPGDALIIVDVQNDFLPGGALAVPHGNEVVPVLNRYIELFERRRLPIIATRDWHPKNHCSFKNEGGIWPEHCIAETMGAEFAKDLKLTKETVVISKADTATNESYSGFGNTELAKKLRSQKVTRVFVGGLATDYCVLNTVLDALKNDFSVFLLQDASRAVNIKPDDGARAESEMISNGAVPINLQTFNL